MEQAYGEGINTGTDLGGRIVEEHCSLLIWKHYGRDGEFPCLVLTVWSHDELTFEAYGSRTLEWEEIQ